MNAGERRARKDLASIYRLIARCGMDDLTHTHVSARPPDEPELLLINRYGDLFREVERLVVIDHH